MLHGARRRHGIGGGDSGRDGALVEAAESHATALAIGPGGQLGARRALVKAAEARRCDRALVKAVRVGVQGRSRQDRGTEFEAYRRSGKGRGVWGRRGARAMATAGNAAPAMAGEARMRHWFGEAREGRLGALHGSALR